MKRRMMRGLLVIGFQAGAVLAADEMRTYTLGECLKIGAERAARTANARRDMQSARAGINEARAEALPHVDLKGNYTRLDELSSFDMGQGPVTLGDLDNYGVSAELSQVLYKGGQVRAALRAAGAYERFAAHGVDRADATLVRDINIGFYDVLLAKAQVAVENESAEQFRRLVAQTETRYAQQAAPEFELLSARVRLANVLPRQIAASNRLELARESLRNLVHLESGPFDLAGTLQRQDQACSLERLLEAAMTNRPEIGQMEEQVRLRREDVNASRAAYKPTIKAFANYRGANNSSYSPTQTEWDWHWTAGVTAEWSFTDGGRRLAVVLQKQLTLENTRTDLDELKRAVALEVRQAYLTLTHAAEAIRVAADTVGLAERGLAIASVRHEQGVSTYLEFTETNLALSTARMQMVEAMHAHAVAQVRVRYATGNLPVEGKAEYDGK